MFEITTDQRRALTTFCDLLLKWNAVHNLTAIRDPNKVWALHIEDALALLAHVPLHGKVLDLGTGGGLPGIPIAILRPDLEVVLLDAVQKKIAFCQHAARSLSLHNVTPLHGRAEEMIPTIGPCDWVLSRATWSLTNYLPIAMSYKAVSGKVVALKGDHHAEELAEAAPFIAENGLSITTIPYAISDGHQRALIIAE